MDITIFVNAPFIWQPSTKILNNLILLILRFSVNIQIGGIGVVTLGHPGHVSS